MKIKHIFFDLDHTLWDFEKNAELCFLEIFKLRQISIDIDVFLKTYRPINFLYWKKFREEKITKEKLRYYRFKDTFDALKYEVSDELIHQLSEGFIDNLPNNNYLIVGAKEILEYLQNKYTLHIITNGFDNVQKLKLKNSDIAHCFKTVTTSESVNVKKPNPKIFKHALQEANAKAEESVMIGDSLEADVIGANEAGIKPIFFNQNNQNITSFTTITTLNDIKQYL